MSRKNIEEALKNLLPVEIIGNHHVYRKRDDSDAQFYRRDDVDYVINLLLKRIQELSEL